MATKKRAKKSPETGSVISPVSLMDGAFEERAPRQRLKEVRRRGREFHDLLMAAEPVPFYRSFELVRVPYPTAYAFHNVKGFSSPFVHIVNRLFVIQFRSAQGIKTLLVSPSDADRNARTPFFDRLSRSFGPFREAGQRLMAPTVATVEQALAQTGLKPEDVDYITYDHLHTQDLRGWMGTREEPRFFPRAKLLVMRQEWISTQNLLPPQQPWYCPEGIDDVDLDRVILLDGDVLLGEGVALIRTPGHTEGNHSVAVRTPEGVMVTSENGVGPDAYAPLSSALKPVRRYAEETGMEVVLNGNTLERGLDQYVSMILEKTIAGPSVRDERFPNVVCSSELAPYWAFPGITPTFQFGNLYFGQPTYPSVGSAS
jgi:hypothetical protein